MTRILSYLKNTPPANLALAWTVLIVMLLSIPGRDIPQVGFSGMDKPVHAFLFFIFTILWARSFRFGRLASIGLAFVFALAFAVLSELYQAVLPFDRIPDRYDVLANWVGSVMGALLTIYQARNTRVKYGGKLDEKRRD